jgi:hypothetical protein
MAFWKIQVKRLNQWNLFTVTWPPQRQVSNSEAWGSIRMLRGVACMLLTRNLKLLPKDF